MNKKRQVIDPLTGKTYKSIMEIIKAHNLPKDAVYRQKRLNKTLREALIYASKVQRPKKRIVDPNTKEVFKSYKALLEHYGVPWLKASYKKLNHGIPYEDQVKGLKPVTKITMEVIKPKKEEEIIQLTGTKPILTEPKFVPFEEFDAINPNHYKSSNMECIDALAETLGSDGIKSFCKGNVIKYLWRYEKKNGVEDLKKAKWYLEKLIELNK